MDLIFFGMQGAGKGTLGKSIAKEFDMEIFETGGQLRKLSNEESPLGHKIKEIINAGRLVPNEVVMEMVEDFVKRIPAHKAVLFDGIPRSVEQAQTLNKLLKEHDRNFRGVLIEISKETALKRLTTRRICKICKTVYPESYNSERCDKVSNTGERCNGELETRADDNPSAIEQRLDLFEKETKPAIDVYKEDLIVINGEPGIEDVKKDAIETLTPLMK